MLCGQVSQVTCREYLWSQFIFCWLELPLRSCRPVELVVWLFLLRWGSSFIASFRLKYQFSSVILSFASISTLFSLLGHISSSQWHEGFMRFFVRLFYLEMYHPVQYFCLVTVWGNTDEKVSAVNRAHHSILQSRTLLPWNWLIVWLVLMRRADPANGSLHMLLEGSIVSVKDPLSYTY